jgi:outer membrane protein assembly factor BamB
MLSPVSDKSGLSFDSNRGSSLVQRGVTRLSTLALAPQDGRELWRLDLPRIQYVTSLEVLDSMLFVLCRNAVPVNKSNASSKGVDTLNVIDIYTGALLWRRHTLVELSVEYRADPIHELVLTTTSRPFPQLSALDFHSASQVWEIAANSPYWLPSSKVHNGLLLVSNNTMTVALDVESGACEWEITHNWSVPGGSPPLWNLEISEGITFIRRTYPNFYSDQMVAVEISTGLELWETSFEHWYPTDWVVQNGLLYVPYSKAGGLSGLVVLASESGDVVWEFPASTLFSATIADAVVIVSSSTHDWATGFTTEIIGLDSATGIELWRFVERDACFVNKPVVTNGTAILYFEVESGSFIRTFDSLTGEILWTLPNDRFGNLRYSRLVEMDHDMLIQEHWDSSEQRLSAVNLRDGQPRWTVELPADLEGSEEFASFVAGKGRDSIYCHSYPSERDNALLSVDRQSGQINWRYLGPSDMWHQVIEAEDGIVLTGSSAAGLIALQT